MSEFEILHALRIMGFGDGERVAAATGLADADAELAQAVERDEVKEMSGRVSGFSLTPAGRERHAELLAQEVTPELTASVTTAYEGFLEPNQEFKALTTAWQTEGSDDRAAMVDRLATVDGKVGEVLDTLAADVPRFATYRPRLASARDAFDGGDDDALARPMSGSYHDVWMELHEDLLVTLGRERDDADG